MFNLLPNIVSFRNSITKDVDDNEANTIAKAIYGKTPVIYSPVNMRSAALRWKMQINENSRMIAFYGTIPEFNHNEIMGWTFDRTSNEFIPIILRDHNSSDVLKCIAETLTDVLRSNGIKPYEIITRGSNDLENNLNMILLGDIVSLYLAYMKGIYPGKIKLRNTDDAGREFS
jgi:glucose/mannose-6-phosphate isomerase